MGQPFHNNVVIITGASSGIGAEMARQLAGQGAKLALAARRADLLEQVAAECRARGGEALIAPTDVTDEAQCKRLIDAALAAYGRLDMLVANAGHAIQRTFEDMPDLERFKYEMALNFYGVAHCVHFALPHLKKTRGRIVGMNSLVGLIAAPTYTGYVASKHAMSGFLNSLRQELRGTGVSVTVIYPGAVLIDAVQEMVGEQIHHAELMTVEECARITIRAAGRRQRQVVMTTQGRIARWVQMIAPGLYDRFAGSAVREGEAPAAQISSVPELGEGEAR